MAKSKSTKTTVKSMAKKALPVVVGLGGFFLLVRFAGHLPIIEDIAKGVRGDTGKFNWFGFTA